MKWPWAWKPMPPTAVEVLQDEVRYLRQSLEAEQKISERLREEVLTLAAAKARQEIEYYRAEHHRQAQPQEAQPNRDQGGDPERAIPGDGLPWQGSLMADGHVPMEMSLEEQRADRETTAREAERLRQAAEEDEPPQHHPEG